MDDMTNDFLKSAKDGNVEEFKSLLSKNSRHLLLNAKSPQNNNTLHVAARFGQRGIIQEILDHQQGFDDLFVKNKSGDTPMHVAAKAGHIQVVDSFINYIKESANTNQDDVESGRSKKRRLRKMLIDRDNEGNTSLHGAVTFRHINVVIKLLEECPELSSLINKAGKSAFSIVVEVKSHEILQTMVNLNVPAHFWMGYYDNRILHKTLFNFIEGDNYDQTILHGTILRNDEASTNIILQEFPELVRRKDMMSRYPLHYAAAAGYTETVDQLLTCNTSIAYKGDIYGQSPLHMTANCGHLEVFTKLLEKCPSTVELVDDEERNVLHLAAANGKKNIVEYLLKLPEIEGLVNARNQLGQTPLHLAAEYFQCEVVQILSEDPRVNIWAIDMVKRTPIKMAEQRFLELEEEDLTANGSSTVQSQNNGVRTAELRRCLTLKALRVAGGAQVRDLEDIMARHHSYRVVRSRRSEELANIIILIATVVTTFTFAAGMAVPGGFINSADKHNGQASLSKNKFFQAFIVFDATAMSLSMTATVVVLWSFWWSKDERFHPHLLAALQILLTALFSMGLAFITGLCAVLSDALWLAVMAGYIVLIYITYLLLFSPLLLSVFLRLLKSLLIQLKKSQLIQLRAYRTPAKKLRSS